MEVADTESEATYQDLFRRPGARWAARGLVAVRLAMGDEAFWRALQSLYRDSLYGIVTPRDLLRHFQVASPVDLRPLFHRYLDYPWIDELGR